jgi:hypothetical protein
MDCFVAACFAIAKHAKLLAMTKSFRISFVPLVPFVPLVVKKNTATRVAVSLF